MYKIDNSTATGALPAPGPVGPTVDGFFAPGVTAVDGDWLNALQEELTYAITQSPGTPALSKTNRTQLKTAIDAYIASATNLGCAVATYSPASGGLGAALTSAIWNNAPLGTLAFDDIGATIQGGNLLRVPAGTYYIDGGAGVQSTQDGDSMTARVYDATAMSELFKGLPSAAASSNQRVGGCVSIILPEKVTFGVTTDLQIDAFRLVINASGGGMNFGPAMSTGTNEIHARLRVIKVA